MNCKLCENYMMKYFDGKLNDIENAQMKQHMKACKVCNRDFSRLDDLIGWMEEEIPAEPPEDFEVQVMRRVRAEGPIRKAPKYRWMVYLYNVAAAACALLLLLLVAGLKNVDLAGTAAKVSGYFSSFSTLTAALYGLLADSYDAAAGIAQALIEVAAVLFKTYYYVIISLLALLVAVYRAILILLDQRRE